jgi:uncharacterized coiled-coil protein SlyX
MKSVTDLQAIIKQGANSMSHALRRRGPVALALWAVLGVMAGVHSARAGGDPPVDLQKEILTELRKLAQRMQEVESGIRAAKASTDTAIIKLSDEMAQLKEQVRRLEDRLNAMPQQSISSSSFRKEEGRLRLVSEYPTEVTVLVNGRSYRLLPYQTRELILPAGTFTYELLDEEFPFTRTRTMMSGETFTVRIFPRR